MNKLCTLYISRIKALFPIMGQAERKYIKTIKINVNDFLIDTPNCTIEDLYEEFGTPEDVITGYYISAGTDNIIKRIRFSKYIKILSLVFILCFLVLTVLRFTILYEGHQIFKEEKIQNEEIIIE